MTATVSSWGNSQGLRLPKSVLEELKIIVGDKIKVFIDNNRIILEPIKKETYKVNIKDLVKDMQNSYKATETFNNRSGVEEW